MAVFDSAVLFIASLSLVTGIWTNVALNKPAWMSSVWHANRRPAGKAVDGNTRSDDGLYAVHTNVGETTAWWKVDLQKQVQSALVILYFRTDYKFRRNGIKLYISLQNSTDAHHDRLCHTIVGAADGTDISDIYNVTCSETWRYLTVYTETDNDGQGAILDFAEVQVSACAPEYYGADCGQLCAERHCKVNSSCDDKMQGQCVGGCADGYQGTDCTQDFETNELLQRRPSSYPWR
ncbi:uncharacterized protein [Haliotis cracherodii]|uniref:uncharacterized protein n=1 Tax=Haliotis cracherodii TaxID=6455 RepID=UPI0039EAA2E8